MRLDKKSNRSGFPPKQLQRERGFYGWLPCKSTSVPAKSAQEVNIMAQRCPATILTK
jgi:hypothetical protein